MTFYRGNCFKHVEDVSQYSRPCSLYGDDFQCWFLCINSIFFINFWLCWKPWLLVIALAHIFYDSLICLCAVMVSFLIHLLYTFLNFFNAHDWRLPNIYFKIHLAGANWKNVAPLNDAWLYLSGCNKCFYQLMGAILPINCVSECNSCERKFLKIDQEMWEKIKITVVRENIIYMEILSRSYNKESMLPDRIKKKIRK